MRKLLPSRRVWIHMTVRCSRWGAGARSGFSSSAWAGKSRDKPSGRTPLLNGSLAGSFGGQREKNLTCYDWMKGAQSPTKDRRCYLDQPCSLSAVTRCPNREESKRCAAEGCRRGRSTKPLVLLSGPRVRRGPATLDERASRASARTTESSRTANLACRGRDEVSCAGKTRNEPTLSPRATTRRLLDDFELSFVRLVARSLAENG
jgi:hypothetical protein